FKKHIVNVHHAKHNLEFDVHYHPLWDWAMDVLQDPHLQPQFVWDAQHCRDERDETLGVVRCLLVQRESGEFDPGGLINTP
ncbi:hypothetical protein EDC04DRAFT_2568183, partial [Pisolithus marmoratus]